MIATSTVTHLAFTCANDGTPLQLDRTKHGLAQVSGIVCNDCQEMYWTVWEEGVLRQGATNRAIYARYQAQAQQEIQHEHHSNTSRF